MNLYFTFEPAPGKVLAPRTNAEHGNASNACAVGPGHRYTLAMSWLARLLGRSQPPAALEPPATSVVVPQDIADRLGASGLPLGEAVEAALREHLTMLEQAHSRGEAAKPFWLQREDEGGVDVEEQLRDRIAQRRSGEAEAER